MLTRYVGFIAYLVLFITLPTVGLAETSISGRVEARLGIVQSDTSQPQFNVADEVRSGMGFSVRRMRLILRGEKGSFGYLTHFQADWGGRSPNLHVADVWCPISRTGVLHIGQLQTPSGWQIALSDKKLLLIDRARMSELLTVDKDVGVRLDLKPLNPPKSSFGIGIFNGIGKASANRGSPPLIAFRAQYHPTENVAIGAHRFFNHGTRWSPYYARFSKKNADPYGIQAAYAAGQADEQGWGLDMQLTKETVTLLAELCKLRIRAPGMSPINADGFYLEAGFFPPSADGSRRLQVLAGYQELDPNTAVTDVYDLRATTLGFNYYVDGYNNLLRLNYELRSEGANPVRNNRLVLQHQLCF